MVGAPRFELGTPSPPERLAELNFPCLFRRLGGLCCASSGFSSGLLVTLQRFGHLVVEDVGVSRRGLEVGVIEGALHQLEVAGVAQKFGREIVSEVVEPESSHTRRLPRAAPARFDAAQGEGIALALDPPPAGPLGDVGEDQVRVMAAQGP